MPSPFDITTVSNTVSLDNNRQGVAVFTVKNDLRRHLHAVVRVTSQTPTADKWLTILPIEGSTDAPNTRDFPVDNTQQIQVKVAVPADGAAGSYSFKLTVADDANPDDNFSTSPDVLFTVHEAPHPAPHPFPPWIIPAVLIGIAILVLLIIGGYTLSHREPPPPAVFADDFATDPTASGKWHFYRATNVKIEDVWDATNQQFYLTTNNLLAGAAAFANYSLTSAKWQASFRYKSVGPDGFVFMFYKDESPYKGNPQQLPNYGGLLGFNGRGYGIEFDSWQNTDFGDPSASYVAIIKDDVKTHYGPVPDSRVGDGAWHNVIIQFDNGRVSVTLDNGLVLDYTLPTPDYTFSGVGFSSGTGSLVGTHLIDNMSIQQQN